WAATPSRLTNDLIDPKFACSAVAGTEIEPLAVGSECERFDFRVQFGHSQQRSGVGLPQPNGVIYSTGSEHPAVVAVRGAVDTVTVPGQFGQPAARGQVPGVDHSIERGGYQAVAGRMKRQAERAPRQRCQALLPRKVPQRDTAVRTARC